MPENGNLSHLLGLVLDLGGEPIPDSLLNQHKPWLHSKHLSYDHRLGQSSFFLKTTSLQQLKPL